ncbi:phosphoglycolate phosphatase [Friedmanniella endophytica]|uniref:Phosphoglycolate phosphatase n=1 Tax=Microlunatus kandeliicorticis TaxID=1759536 RepID=A0A7W3ISX4_9ACTN|nr:HAD hydrolase-like protein [Microlunatus kandeliicorticis]MBA8794613.1 phosphoglycolate phosphatase [Microlunatus kandeliicorticis]
MGDPVPGLSVAGRMVLFDLDGTLVDSAPGIHASVRFAAAALGLPAPTPTQLNAMVGPPLQEGFVDVLGVPAARLDAAVDAYRTHYRAGAMFDVTVFAGIPDLLAALGAAGAVLAVTTSKPEVFARDILAAVGLFDAFASVHGATLDGAVRHKEQVVRLGLEAHPGTRDPVLVGDRAQDVLGARRHGLPCVGAGWGAGDPGELEAAGAAVICASPAEVPGALRSLRPAG